MWVLLLNDMRSLQIQILQPVFRAETKEALKAFVESQKVESYKTIGTHVIDETFPKSEVDIAVQQGGKIYHKTFKLGGPLEWFNPPYNFKEHDHYVDMGTAESWMAEARINYKNKILSIMEVPQ